MAEFQPQPVKGPDDPQQFSSENIIIPESRWSRFTTFLRDNKWYVAAIILGLVIIGALAVFAFWPQQEERTQEAKVELTIDAPETAQSGGEVIYKIKVLNQDDSKLVDMNLELVYDDGLEYVSSSPKSENLSGSSFEVPDLGTGQNAVVIVKALAQGSVNDSKRLVARLRYRFDNFNSPFTAETSHEVRLVAADVVLDLSGPEQANTSEVVKYELYYRNSSDKDIDSARIKLTYPEGFSFSSSEPSTSLSNNQWNIGTLKANSNGKIAFQGSFGSARTGQSFQFTAEFLVTDDNGEFFTQSSTSFGTTISTRPLSVEAKLTGSAAGGIVNPGDTITVELQFRNNTQVVNTGVQVIAQIESSSIVPGSIKTESGFVQDQTVTWNGSSLQLLENLNPNDGGSVKMQFQVTKPATSSGDKSLTITVKPRIKSNQNTSLIPGSDLNIKISSPSALNGSVSHVDGALPPQVGTQSGFKVRLALRNSSNDYRNGQLIGYVPIGTTLDVGSITASEKNLVKFDSTSGRLTWDVGQLLAHAGTIQPERALEFNIRFTPSSSQVGQGVTLFKTITFTAVDDFTSQDVSLEENDLSTSDIANTSDGRVRQ